MNCPVDAYNAFSLTLNRMVNQCHFDQFLSGKRDRIAFRNYLDTVTEDGMSVSYTGGCDLVTLSDNSDGFQLKMSCGATRFVLIDMLSDWVFKAMFTGFHRNYCARESHNFQQAVCADLGEFFAPTYYVGKFYGIDFYCMRKVETNYDDMSERAYEIYCSSSRARIEWEESSSSDYFDSGDVYAAQLLFINFYGEETFNKLDNFCCEHNINDLHVANCGYLDGKLVYIDYGGF